MPSVHPEEKPHAIHDYCEGHRRIRSETSKESDRAFPYMDAALTPFVRTAHPETRFQHGAALKLTGEMNMSPSPASPIPNGMHTITPHLVCREVAAAIAFYCKAFGTVELERLPGPEGKLMHAMIRIGDSNLMLVDEFPGCGSLGPQSLKGSPVTIHLYVTDVDATVERAVAADAKVTMPVADMFWDNRYSKIEDPFGHPWSIATHPRDLSPQEIQVAAATLRG